LPSACKGVVKYRWELQVDATLNVVAVQNTWYTILPTTEDVRILEMMFQLTGFAETIEYELTVDGSTRVGTEACIVLPAEYYPIVGYRYPDANLLKFRTVDRNAALYQAVEGHSVRIRMRKTTAAGATTVQAVVFWERLIQV